MLLLESNPLKPSNSIESGVWLLCSGTRQSRPKVELTVAKLEAFIGSPTSTAGINDRY